MKRSLKKNIVLFVGGLAVLLMLLSTTTYVLLLIPSVQNFAKTTIEKQLDTLLVGRITIGAIRSDLLSAITIYDVSLHNLSPLTDSIVIKRIHARFSISKLLSKTIQLSDIRIDRAAVNLFIGSNAHFNFPALSPQQKKSVPDTASSDWKIELKTVLIRNLSVTYADSNIHIATIVHDSRITGRFFRLDSFSVRIHIPEPSLLSTPYWHGTIQKLYAIGTLSSHGVLVENLQILGTDGEANASGYVPFSAHGRWDCSALVTTSVSQVDILKQVHQIAPVGRLRLAASLKEHFAAPQIHLSLQATSLKAAGLPVDTLQLTSAYMNDSVTANATFFAAGAQGKATLTARIPALFSKPTVGAYTLSLQVRDVQPSYFKPLHPALDSLALQIDAVSAQVSAAGAGLKVPSIVSLDATVTSQKHFATPCAIAASMKKTQWNIAVDLGKNNISGSGTLAQNGALAGAVTGTIADVPLITNIFTTEPISGTFFCQARLGGTITKPSIKASVNAPKLTWRTAVFSSMTAVCTFEKNRLIFDTLASSFTANLQPVMASLDLDSIGGAIFGSIEARGTLLHPQARITLTGDDLFYKRIIVPSLTIKAAMDGMEAIRFSALELKNSRSTIAGRGSLTLKPAFGCDLMFQVQQTAPHQENEGSDGEIAATATFLKKSINASLSLTKLSLTAITCWLPDQTNIPVSALITAAGRIQGTTTDPFASLSFSLLNPAYGTYRISSVAGKAEMTNLRITAKADCLLHDTIQPLHLTANIPVSLKNGFSLHPTDTQPVAFTLHGTKIALNAVSHLLPDSIKTAGGLAELSVTLSDQGKGMNINGSAAITKTTLSYTPLSLKAKNINCTATAIGVLNNPALTFRLASGAISMKSQDIRSSTWVGRLYADTIHLDTGYAIFTNGGALRITGNVPITTIDSLLNTVDPDVTLELSQVPLKVIENFTPGLSVESGTLHGDVLMVLNNGRIALKGRLRLANGVLRFEQLDQKLGPFTGDVLLSGDTITIKQVTGAIGGGTIGLQGTVVLLQGARLWVSLAVKMRNNAFDLPEIGLIRLQNGDVQIESEQEQGYRIKGALRLGETIITRDVGVNDLIIKPRLNLPTEPPNPFLENLHFQVEISADENLSIKSNLGDLHLDGRGAISGTAAKPGFIGDVSVIKGYVYYLDREFDVSEGKVSLYDPFELNPSFAISASTKVSAMEIGTTEPAEYTVTLSVTGDLQHPTFMLTSSPPLDEPNIVSLLTMGAPIGSASTGMASRIGNLVGKGFLGFGTRKLERLFNLQSIAISGDIFGMQTQTVPEITVTKRLSNRLTVSYMAGLSVTNQQKISIIYRLFPFLFITGETDDQRNTTVNLKLKITR
ncbi:MAG: translocation/assembly module TamB domain-containing protein [Chitinivibrionales bacterium]|nr:translocation/assembly module TamB domain-containing protein [Chitinivibrionales bacterium]